MQFRSLTKSIYSFNEYSYLAFLFVIRAQRKVLFEQEVLESETENLLDRALLKAKHNKTNGVITAADYHKIAAKVDSLKKLVFTEQYEKLQDRETYEYMKYKVAAEVGG